MKIIKPPDLINRDVYILKCNNYKCNAEFELSPHQLFVRNFLSFQTPYNSLLLYHGLGTGKTCSAITVAEEMRDYLNNIGLQKKIIVVASPNVQENFKLQLFPDNKLNMGPFGPDFEIPFEIQVDKDYFQKIFGEGTGPQKRDVIHFPRTGRVYEVSSSYLFRDFMNEPLYFKVMLIKWLPKSNVDQSESLNNLEAFTVSASKLFGKEKNDEEIKKWI
jgi:hypothetical protein